jgi:hypothetical protein
MRHIFRKSFPDRLLAGRDFRVAEHLLASWYRRSQRWSLLAPAPSRLTEFRLEGFPRSQAVTLRKLLEERLASSGRSEDTIEVADPDTLVLSGPPTAFSQAGPASAWLEALSPTEFDGLVLTVRLTVGVSPRQHAGAPTDQGGIALTGLLGSGRLLLKAVWPANRSGCFPEAHYEHATWPREKEFLNALDVYLEDRKIAHAGRWVFLFSSSWRKLARRAVMYSLMDAGLHRNLMATIARVVFFAGVFVFAEWGWPLVRPTVADPPALMLALDVMLFAIKYLSLFGLLIAAGVPAGLLWMTHARMKAGLRTLYSHPIIPVVVDPAQEPGLADVSVRKLSADIEASGGRYGFDYRVESAAPGLQIMRAFTLPADSAYLLLSPLSLNPPFKSFPELPVLYLIAYSTDGHHLMVTTTGQGFQKPRTANETVRHLPRDLPPDAFLTECRRILKRMTAEEARRLVPLMSREEFLERQRHAFEEVRQGAREQGYFSWAAAFRQVFNLPRPEYRESS